MQLGAARATLGEGESAYRPITEAERLAKQASAELTTLIRELRPAGLDSKPLSEVLRTHVEDWSRQNGIRADFIVDGNFPNDLPEGEALFRVTQESLANVARHSKASQVTVKLTITPNDVVLTVEDNGVGFDMADGKKGVGLDSMRERLDAVGGQLDISTQKTNGTKITARVRRS
jgi:NarL family two-component system sensor histidine kinase LiaS